MLKGKSGSFLVEKNKNALLGFIMMFVLPILLWAFIFRHFLNGTITLMKDSYANYSMFKFFFNNFFNGVIPIWDPFVELGVPNIAIANTGVLSPFMALFAFLHYVGLNYYFSYMLFIVSFFILGLTGFYLLALEVLEDRFYAWIAFIAFLFSGMAPMLFNQIFIYFIFCPAVWMFYFLIRFFKDFEPKYLLGLTMSFMNLLCFYIPFYFLSLLLFFVILFLVLYPSNLKIYFREFQAFMIQHRKSFFACIFLLAFALIPLIFFKLSLNSGDSLFLCRRANSEKIVLTEKKLNDYNSSTMTFDEVSLKGTLGERIKGGRIFSHLDKYDYSSDGFFYIPVLIYLIIFISPFVSFGRKQFFLFCLGISVFFLSLGQAAPLHKVLFDTIFYFKYFRNFFFFMGYLMPIVILFAMFQLKGLLDAEGIGRSRWQNVIINTSLHVCFFCMLLWHGNILVSTYVTVVLSCILFNLLFLKSIASRSFLLILMILEPLQVFINYDQNSLNYHFSAPATHVASVFKYQRPVVEPKIPFYIYPDTDIYRNYWYDLLMNDSTGFIIERPVIVSKFTYILSKSIKKDVFSRYIRNKFYLYDHVQVLHDLDPSKLEYAIQNNVNLAFISDPLLLNNLRDLAVPPTYWEPGKAPLSISQDTDQFKVVSFDPDRIHLNTDFSVKKFLVYTDSYEKYWSVTVNDQLQNLYRANMAFKGVWLPAGKNDVVIQYSMPWEKVLYLSVFLINFLVLIFFIRSICLKKS